MGDGTETLEAYLRGGTLYRVNGAEEAIDFLGIVVAFEGDEAIADDLQMLFGFRLEEFEDFGTDFVVGWQRIEIGAGESGLRDLVECRRSCRRADRKSEEPVRPGTRSDSAL